MSEMDKAELIALKHKASAVADLLRQLANPTRLLLLCHIGQGERSVSELEAETGLRQPGLSQQLAELRQAGLVQTRRESRLIFYSIADSRAQILMQTLYQLFCTDAAQAPTAMAPLVASIPPEPTTGDAARFARVHR